MGAIPKWAWILFLIVAVDDILLWMQSPYLALPLTVVLVVVGIVFAVGGKGLAVKTLCFFFSLGQHSFFSILTSAFQIYKVR